MELVAGLTLKNLRPRVWDAKSEHYMPRVTAVMISFDELRRSKQLCRRAIDEGFTAVLGPSGAKPLRVFLDNGAFACLRRGGEPVVAEYLEFVRAVQPDWCPVPADFIPLPSQSYNEQRRRYLKTIRVLERHPEPWFCPVVHPGPWFAKYLETLERLGRTDQVAVGGLVPHLLNSAGSQRVDVVRMVRAALRDFPGPAHAFGIGGVATLHLAASLGFASADSTGWRQRAARGLVILRGRGERQAVKLGSWKGRAISPEEWEELARCRCAACRCYGPAGLRALGVEGFVSRAAHNLHMLLDELSLINRHLAAGDFPEWSRKRLAGHPMAYLVHSS